MRAPVFLLALFQLGGAEATLGQVSDTTLDSLALARAHRLAPELLRRLPIDNPRHAFGLIPGVVLRGDAIGIAPLPQLSIRGSPMLPSEYVDGASIRFQVTHALGLAPLVLSGTSIYTSVPPLAFADAGGGVVAYETAEGGDRLAGALRWDSDEPFGRATAVGYNRFDGTLSGPLGPGWTFLLSSTVQGQASSYRGRGAAAQPAFLPVTRDTVVSTPAGNVTLPGWVQVGGECAAAANGGFDCQGLWRPLDWSTARRLQGKLAYGYGPGSKLTFTAFAGDLQQRFFPGQRAGAASLYTGGRISTLFGIANWRHALGDWRGGPLALAVNVSLVRQRGIVGMLTPESQAATRDPGLGIAFEMLRFVGTDSIPVPLPERIVTNLWLNSGVRVPFINRPDLSNFQPFRANPFGLMAGWPTQGLDGPLTFATESRLQGRVALEWARGAHRATFGVDAERGRVSRYDAPSVMRQSFVDGWVEQPDRLGAFAGDRLTRGRTTIDLGIRLDHFAPGGLFPNTPGRIYTNPAFNRPASLTNPDSLAASVARVFRPATTKSVVSPRVQLAYATSPQATVQVAYARWVERPPWADYFQRANADLDVTSTNDAFGRDVDFRSTTLLEAGVRAALGGAAEVYVAVYRTAAAEYVRRILPFPDPFNPGDTVNLIALTARTASPRIGADARLEWTPVPSIQTAAVYGVADEDGVTYHSVAAVAALQVPSDWRVGSVLGALGRDAGAVITLRAASGLPYTRLLNFGAGTVAPGGVPLFVTPAEPLNASRLPWTGHVDLRLGKTVRVGGRDWEIYLDARNLLDLHNTFALFAETGGVVNDQHRLALLTGEYAGLRNEASANSALLAGDAIDLSACASWANAPNCVALRRTEARFGNGDGTYELTEQTRALNAYYDTFFGPWRFAGITRTVRFGVRLGL